MTMKRLLITLAVAVTSLPLLFSDNAYIMLTGCMIYLTCACYCAYKLQKNG